jgi:hypothetical protein
MTNIFNDFENELELSLPADNLQAMEIDAERSFHRRRLGMFTASMISKIMTGSRTKGEIFGDTAKKEIYRIAAERTLTDHGAELYIDELMKADYKQTRWGKDNEADARELFSEKTGLSVRVCTSMRHDDMPYFSATPDGITEDGTLVEIKCPYNIAGMYDEDYVKAHIVQMQSQMAVYGLSGCYFVKYDPRLTDKIRVMKINWDQDMISTIETRVKMANDMVIELIGAELNREWEIRIKKEDSQIDSNSICQHCKFKKGDFRINPYIDELFGRKEWQYICGHCYKDLLGDI